MGMRITTNGVFQGYRSNLSKSYTKLNKSMTRVSTQRNFSAYSEDVSAASRAFQLRRSCWRADMQINNSNYVISKFETAWTSVDYLVDNSETEDNLNGLVEALKALNDPIGGSRNSLGQSLLGKAESIVRLMNTQYGDQFIFAGADGKNVPYSWGENGELLFRGIDVDTPVGLTESEFGALDGDFSGLDGFEDYLSGQGKSAADADYDDYKDWFKTEKGVDDTAFANGLKLKEMANETTYVDIGLGIKWDDNGEFVPSSAYNSALSGLNILGYGVDEDGDSKNLAVLLRQMGEMLKDCDSNTGAYPEGWDTDRVSALTNKIDAAVDAISVQHTKLSGDVTYLNTNLKQLEKTRDQLNDQIIDIEQPDAADSISDFLYARYSYNAALQVGTSILTNTLLDYLR